MLLPSSSPKSTSDFMLDNNDDLFHRLANECAIVCCESTAKFEAESNPVTLQRKQR